MKRIRRVKVHKEGAGLLTAMGIVLTAINVSIYALVGVGWLFFLVLGICLVLYGLVVNFFRSPRRMCPHIEDSTMIISPADGRVVAIEEVEECEYIKERCLQVSVFMSVFNVHANWCPCHGTVEQVAHHNGRFMAAYLPKSSTENERSAVVIRTETGHRILVRQIAGALARRIVTYTEVGEECSPDDQLGFIKFGSRVDLYLPVGTEVSVGMNQPVVGNQTILARLPQ